MEELEELRLSRLRLGRNQQLQPRVQRSWGLCISEPQPSPGTTHGERMCASGLVEYFHCMPLAFRHLVLHTWNSGSQRQSNLPEGLKGREITQGNLGPAPSPPLPVEALVMALTLRCGLPPSSSYFSLESLLQSSF